MWLLRLAAPRSLINLRFLTHRRNLRRWGCYQCQLGPNCYASEGIGISNTPEKCGKELTEGYVSGENDCLISCGGGEMMCEILEHVDFEAIRKAPAKWYLGYSDNNEFHLSSDDPLRYGFYLRPLRRRFRHGTLASVGEGFFRGSHRRGADGAELRWLGTDRRRSENRGGSASSPDHITEPFMLKKYPDQDGGFFGKASRRPPWTAW